MRNLKKVLALVLAMVMTLSLVMVVNADTATDKFNDVDSISDEFLTAANVLGGLEVYIGDDAGDFNPTDNITRAEVATIMYRIHSGDVKGENAEMFKSQAAQFTDTATHWAAGYIGYCVNGNIILGRGDGTFDPQGDVTGYETLVMALRVAGYDKPETFKENYPVKVGVMARQLEILDGLSDAQVASLSKPVNRQVVAQIVFNVLTKVETVAANALWDYAVADGGAGRPAQVVGNGNGGDYEQTLAWKNFRLDWTYLWDDLANWGRPCVLWYRESGNGNNWDGGVRDVFIATEDIAPVVSYNEAVTECDVVDDVLGEDDDIVLTATDRVYLNGARVEFGTTDFTAQFGGNAKIEAKETKNFVGANGRLTEIYEIDWDDDGIIDRRAVIMIDEFLAKVTGTTTLKTDANDHVDVPAKLYLDVYDRDTNADVATSTIIYNYDEDWEWTEGDMLLVNLETEDRTNDSVVCGPTNDDGDENYSTKWDPDYSMDWNIIGDVEGVAGTATKMLTADRHEIDGEVYNDAIRFHHDEAIYNGKLTWYFDSTGKFPIGSFALESVYGAIEAIWWVDSNEDGNDGYAKVKLHGVDDSVTTYKIYAITDGANTVVNANVLQASSVKNDASYAKRQVSQSAQYNEDEYVATKLYKVESDATGNFLVPQIVLDDAAKSNGNVQVKTGEPNIAVLNGVVKAAATANTLFLSWNEAAEKFTAKKGISNALTGKADTTNQYWAVYERGSTKWVKYIFYTEKASADPTKTLTFYKPENTKLGARYIGEGVWEVYSGAFVNGVELTEGDEARAAANILLVKDGENSKTTGLIRQMIDSAGKMMALTKTGDYVNNKTANVIREINLVPSSDTENSGRKVDDGRAAYAGSAEAAEVHGSVLAVYVKADGDDTEHQTNFNLKSDTLIFNAKGKPISAQEIDDQKDCYLYIVYAYDKDKQANAKYIFCGSKQVPAVYDVTTDPLDEAGVIAGGGSSSGSTTTSKLAIDTLKVMGKTIDVTKDKTLTLTKTEATSKVLAEVVASDVNASVVVTYDGTALAMTGAAGSYVSGPGTMTVGDHTIKVTLVNGNSTVSYSLKVTVNPAGTGTELLTLKIKGVDYTSLLANKTASGSDWVIDASGMPLSAKTAADATLPQLQVTASAGATVSVAAGASNGITAQGKIADTVTGVLSAYKEDLKITVTSETGTAVTYTLKDFTVSGAIPVNKNNGEGRYAAASTFSLLKADKSTSLTECYEEDGIAKFYVDYKETGYELEQVLYSVTTSTGAESAPQPISKSTDGSYTIAGGAKLKGVTAITIYVTKKAVAKVTLKVVDGTNGGTISVATPSGTSDGDKIYVNDDITFSVSAATGGYYLAKVEYAVGAAGSAPTSGWTTLTASSGTSYTAKAPDAGWGGAVWLRATTYAEELTVKASKNYTTPLKTLTVNGTDIKGGSATKTVGCNTNIVIVVEANDGYIVDGVTVKAGSTTLTATKSAGGKYTVAKADLANYAGTSTEVKVTVTCVEGVIVTANTGSLEYWNGEGWVYVAASGKFTIANNTKVAIRVAFDKPVTAVTGAEWLAGTTHLTDSELTVYKGYTITPTGTTVTITGTP